METLVLDGKKYIKASHAARSAGYTSDYVGQLCRAEKIDAHLIGRTWYVNEDELVQHRHEAKRSARVKAREQVKKELAARKQTQGTAVPVGRTTSRNTAHFEQRVNVRYEPDTTDLIPEVRKLHVGEVEGKPKAQKRTVKKSKKQEKHKDTDTATDTTEDSDITYTNKGNVIQMEGELKIKDATHEYFMSDATVLTPRIEKKSTQRSVDDAAVNKEQTPVFEHKKVRATHKDAPVSDSSKEKVVSRFLSRVALLEDQDVSDAAPEPTSEERQEEPAPSTAHTVNTEQGGSWFLIVLVLMLNIVLSGILVFGEVVWLFTNTGTVDTVDSSYGFTSS